MKYGYRLVWYAFGVDKNPDCDTSCIFTVIQTAYEKLIVSAPIDPSSPRPPASTDNPASHEARRHSSSRSAAQPNSSYRGDGLDTSRLNAERYHDNQKPGSMKAGPKHRESDSERAQQRADKSVRQGGTTADRAEMSQPHERCRPSREHMAEVAGMSTEQLRLGLYRIGVIICVIYLFITRDFLRYAISCVYVCIFICSLMCCVLVSLTIWRN